MDAQTKDHVTKVVPVTVDGTTKQVPEGTYDLVTLKEVLGVAPDRDLDLLEHGKLKPIKAEQKVHLREGMEFVSRQTSGGSS
jgi:hypothetical protein